MMRIEDLRNEFKTISEFESIICKKDIKKRKNFQRLEFLGDKVLGLILLLQIVLGILTVTSGAQMFIASMHQISSILLVSFSVYFLFINTKKN